MQRSSNRRANGVYYFLGNVHQHLIHALPLYDQTGGEFVVLSQESYDFCVGMGVPVILIDDKPELFLQFDSSKVQATVSYLNTHARIVIFYEVFSISSAITAKQLMCNHGNSFKDYYIEWRQPVMQHYDFIAGLGPAWREKILAAGIPDDKILDVGLARWDAIIKPHDSVADRHRVFELLGLDEKPVVTYFPTWWGPSSVYTLGQDIVRYISDDYNVLFRPHPDTPGYIMHDYLRIIKHKPNVRYVPEQKYPSISLADLYSVSNVFIGDMSSVVLDAVLAHKPLLFAFDAEPNRQDAAVYAPMQEIFDQSIKLDAQNVSNMQEHLRQALEQGISEVAWRASEARIFYGLGGDTVPRLAAFVAEQIRHP